MGKIAYQVRPWELGPLRSLMPCRCNEDPSKDASFYVNVETGSSYIYGDGPKVKEVHIECNCCHRTAIRDVESWGILEKNLNF